MSKDSAGGEWEGWLAVDEPFNDGGSMIGKTKEGAMRDNRDGRMNFQCKKAE